MATFTIATIGNKEDNKYFEIAKQQLEQQFLNDKDTEIRFVDITGKNEDEILAEGALHGIMYFTNIHDSTNADTLKTMLNLQLDINDLNFFTLSHEPVTSVEHDSEQSKINHYIEETFPDAKINVTPANVRTEKDMRNFTDGIIPLSLLPYFNYVRPLENATQEKVNLLLNIVKKSIEAKHEYTAGHEARVPIFAEEIAKTLGCTENEIQDIIITSKLHDIGKILIPDEILASSRQLSFAERKQMNYHSQAGAQLLETLTAQDDELAQILNPEVLKGIKYHHKFWDGKHDKQSDEIDPINHERIGKYASIISVADSLDAMITQRAYNNPKHILDTFRDLWDNRDKQFEPKAAEAAVLVLGKEIATLGYDPLKMFSEISKDSKNTDIDKGLQEFFQKHSDQFVINNTLKPDAYCKLGFRLNENGYFEFEGKNAPVLDPSIRLNDEIDFLTHHPDKIDSIPQGIDLPKEEIEKAARIQAQKKFEEQDFDGNQAIIRATAKTKTITITTAKPKEHSIPNQINNASKKDYEYNTSNYKENISLTRSGLENDARQNEAGIKEQNSFAPITNNQDLSADGR